jgi:hypothetical protein
VGVIATFVAAVPLAAWVAAPQGVLSEVPAFAEWAARDGEYVTAFLDECGDNAVEVRMSPARAADLSPVAVVSLRALEAAQFTSNSFRDVVSAYTDATRWCASGLRLVAAGQPATATAEFTASLCRYIYADAVLGSLDTVATPSPVAVVEFCRSATKRPVPE